MNDCLNGELRDLLPDLLHDRLSAAERRRLEAHVAECEDCRAELALLHDLRGSLRRVPAVDVGGIVAAILPYRAPALRSWGGWRAAAAALIAVGGTSLAIATHSTSPSAAGSAATVAPVAVTAPTTREAMPPSAETVPTSTGARVATAAPAARSRELTAGGTVADLSDQELAALLDGIETLDVVPSTDVEPVVPAAAAAANAQGES
jgi:hypothetical protein